MPRLSKLILIISIFVTSHAATASEQGLLINTNLRLENILQFMEYGSAVEQQCATVNQGRAYKNWLVFNLTKLSAMTRIQKAYQLKAVARDDQQVKKYLKTSAAKREQMVTKAVGIIANGSAAMQQRLCNGLQEMVTASDDRLLVDSQLAYLAKHEEKIIAAIYNNANWNSVNTNSQLGLQ